jgi:hypothetical protein
MIDQQVILKLGDVHHNQSYYEQPLCWRNFIESIQDRFSKILSNDTEIMYILKNEYNANCPMMDCGYNIQDGDGKNCVIFATRDDYMLFMLKFS